MNPKPDEQDALEPVIAERLLRSGSTAKRLTVRMGMPRKVTRGEWLCPYQIRGLDGSAIGGARGLDALQAILMAVEAIRLRLEADGASYKWAGGEEGDAGFPRAVPAYFGPEFATAINRLIDREVGRFSRAAERESKRKSKKRSR